MRLTRQGISREIMDDIIRKEDAQRVRHEERVAKNLAKLVEIHKQRKSALHGGNRSKAQNQ